MTLPTKQAFSLFDEFKNFAFKGNVIDLAVGVIIGGAFGKIVSSMVDNLIMPLVSVFMGDVVSFLILAMALFIFIVKFLGWIMQAKAAVAIEPPPVSEQRQALDVLIEIRDQLKQR